LVKDDFKVLRGWDPSRCSLTGYLSVVATSACLDFVRLAFHSYTRRRVAVRSDTAEGKDLLSTVEDKELSPEERLQRLEIEDRVLQTVEKWSEEGSLKEKDKLLLNLKLRGLNSREIANILGISEQNANTRFSRLKKEFRKRLSRAGVEADDSGG
jgi:RNA polymerase sigma factor (sigma-70 family)